MPTNTLQQYIAQAFEHYYAYELEQAEMMLRRALELDPTAPEPIIHLANLLRMRRRLEQAIEILQPLATPEAPIEYRRLLFEAYWSAGNFRSAHPLAVAILEQLPSGDERIRELVEYARQAGEWNFARQAAQHLNDPRSLEELRWIRRIAFVFNILPFTFRNIFIHSLIDRFGLQNRWRISRILLEAACRCDSTNAEWPLRLGQLYRKTRDVYEPQWEKEKVSYQFALQKDPTNADAVTGLLYTLFDMERWDEVLQLLEKETHVGDKEFRLRLQAACTANQGKLDEADAGYCELAKGTAAEFARLNRALIALERKEYPAAAAYLTEPTPPGGLNLLVSFFREAAEHLSHNPVESLDGQKIWEDVFPDLSWSTVHPQTALERGEPTTCRLCGKSNVKIPLWRETITGWVRARCPHCSFISVDPMPSLEAIREFYTQPQRSHLSTVRLYRQAVLELTGANETACRRHPLFHDITQWNRQWDWRQFEEKIDSEKRILDIGCSAGRVLDLFQRIGWQAEGMDVDAEAVKFARSRGLKAHIGTLETWERPEAYYQLITMVDVIEHVEAPAVVVKKCFDLLQPGGVFFIKTPCADSLPHGFLGHCWLDFSEHLSFFSRRTLEKLVTDTGFCVVGIKQKLEPTIPFIFYEKWQQQLFPQLLHRWINYLNVGDTILLLAQKPGSRP